MANTTNFNWETPDDTDLVKDGAAAIRTLGSAIDTSLVDLKGGTTGQVLSKATNTDMDFTWVTSDDANAIQNAIVDAKGDLIAASAADTPARLAVGTDNQRLVAASGEATGLKYVSDTQNTVIDAKGDLLVGSSADTLARLAVGTNDFVLTADSTATNGIKWAAVAAGATFVGCSLYKSAAQSIANDSSTTITWDSENYDTDSLHSTVTNTSRITIPSGKGGKWLFTGCMAFASNGTKVRRTNLVVNGTTSYLPIAQQATVATDGDSTHGTFAWPLNLVAGDYVEMQAYQNSGGSLDFKTASVFTATYLGA